jgi:hypothetical protein
MVGFTVSQVDRWRAMDTVLSSAGQPSSVSNIGKYKQNCKVPINCSVMKMLSKRMVCVYIGLVQTTYWTRLHQF